MSIAKAIYTLIDGVSGEASIYHLHASQDAAPPYIVFQRVDRTILRSINRPSGVEQAEFQIDVYATDYPTAESLSDQIQTLLDGYRGTVQYGEESPVSEIKIGGISLLSGLDLPDRTDQPFLYRVSTTYLITYHKE